MTDPPTNPKQFDGTYVACPSTAPNTAVTEAARRFGLCVQDIETVVRSIGQTARECQVIFEDFREALDEAAKPRTPRQPAQRASYPRYRRPGCRVMQSTRRPAHRQVARKKRRF